ncbi:hypothetical protein A140_12195 [Vibrio crassostreae 9ZC88]|nr:hypothetical protein A140_12195 [Vibrio crassostreae 9ZC88]
MMANPALLVMKELKHYLLLLLGVLLNNPKVEVSKTVREYSAELMLISRPGKTIRSCVDVALVHTLRTKSKFSSSGDSKIILALFSFE